MSAVFKSFLTFLLLGIFASCGGGDDTPQLQGKGEVWLGGTIHVQSPEKVTELFPHGGTNRFTRDVTYQIFETLLRYDTETMETIPSIAKKYTVSEDGLKYTFTIRKDVYFHKDECFKGELKKLTAEDVKFSLDLACSGLKVNKSSYLLINRIKGAKSFHKKTKTKLTRSGVSGIQVTGDYEISIDLIDQFAGFEKVLTHSNLSIIAQEAFDMYGKDLDKHPVGTGPFMLEELTSEHVLLKRFDQYWRKDNFGNRLPYLDGIELTYFTDKQNELNDFQNEKTDIVLNIPAEEINHLLGSLAEAQNGENVIHKVYSEPSMSVSYIGFANQSKEFRDIRVRKAFNHAINRTYLINSFLGGEGWPAQNGFLPPLDFYPNDDVTNLNFDVELAKSLMAQAGYPEGSGFPKIDIYVNALPNSTAHNMVKGVVQQLKTNLGIELGIKLCGIIERDKAIAEGKAKLWRAGWIADYPHTENFLSLFYSRNISSNNNTINSFRYVSPEYDDILEQATREQNVAVRNQLYVMCDQKIVDDAVVMPILTGDFLVLLNKKVKNLRPNPMELIDFSTIFIKMPK